MEQANKWHALWDIVPMGEACQRAH